MLNIVLIMLNLDRISSVLLMRKLRFVAWKIRYLLMLVLMLVGISMLEM